MNFGAGSKKELQVEQSRPLGQGAATVKSRKPGRFWETIWEMNMILAPPWANQTDLFLARNQN